jgi:hypothetical protein
VTTLVAWAAKRSILARIQAWADQAAPGDPLAGLDIAYSLPVNPDRVSVYGGRTRSTRTQAGGEHALLIREDITVEIRVRVNEQGGDDESAERTAEGIAQRIAVAVSAEPRITTGSVLVSAIDQDPTVISGDPDPWVTVNVVLIVSLSMLTGGS